MQCPYCHQEAEWVENKAVYGKNYGKSFMMYLCRKCDARVGCHQNTRTPLGIMANKELREWRMKAHAVVDPLWKSGELSRGEVYQILKEHFGKVIHIGETNVETCKKIIEFLKK
jgi:uncharacterized protein YlaI